MRQQENPAPVDGYRLTLALEAHRVAEAEAVVDNWHRQYQALLAIKVSGEQGRLTRRLELLVRSSAGVDAVVALERALAGFGSYRREPCFLGVVMLDLAAASDAVARAKEVVRRWNERYGTAWSYAYQQGAKQGDLSKGRFQVALSNHTPPSALAELTEALARLGPVREVTSPVL